MDELNEQPEQLLIIDRQTAQAVLNYLQTKPYAEVYGLIAALVQLKPKERKAEPPLDFVKAEEAKPPLASAASGNKHK